MKIAVGLSGGVDSSVAAYLLKNQGHEVLGIWMDLFNNETASEDAHRVADFLEIPFYIIKMKSEYDKIVVSYLKNEYNNGKTPNPCVICNREVKFGIFLEKALKAGIEFDYFATGHYSIINFNEETGRYNLRKGFHEGKDQAYFLSMLKQEQLAKILFPLGGKIKSEVRDIALKAGLFTSNKTESQDLCSGDYRQFIDNTRGPGNFIDSNGKVLGSHKGIENYTIGQRRGLGISSSGEPWYVTGLNPELNEVILGINSDLLNKGMIVSSCNWISVMYPDFPIKADTKIRYRDNGAPAILHDMGNNSVRVDFQSDRRAVTPGQIAVFYENDMVIGAGIIKEAY